MKPVKATMTRNVGVEEMLMFEVEVKPDQDVHEQLQPFYDAFDARTGQRNQRVLEFQNAYRGLSPESKQSIDLALDFLHGRATLAQLKQANENYDVNHPQPEGGESKGA